MLKVIILLVAPLIVYALSDSSVRSISTVSKQKPEQKSPETPSIDAPGTTTQLDLFLDDEDFDIVDLINADRSNK